MSIPILYESIYYKVYVCQFVFNCCEYVLKYARLYINVDHFQSQDGGRLPCRLRWVPGFILIYIYKTTSVPILVLLSQNAQSDEKVILSRCTNRTGQLRQGAKTIKKNTNSTQNKSKTHRAKQYEVTSFLNTDFELSTETCSKNVYSLGPRLHSA